MLKSTFIHIPGIGYKTESKLWHCGVLTWTDFLERNNLPLSQNEIYTSRDHIENSIKNINKRDPKYFSDRLPSSQMWRLFEEFRDSAVYLDIETTGLGFYNNITTIALYDGEEIKYYVHGQNLDQFKEDIKKYKLLITYNGKTFDVPFIENYFDIKLDQSHIDLRYVLHSLGHSGGLKACEKRFGIERNELEGVTGYFAVILWNEYIKNNNDSALETLIAYNIEDVLNLETLMIHSYNLKVGKTTILKSNKIPVPVKPKNLFDPDQETIEKLKASYAQSFYSRF